jgi:hypothetical protein
MRVFRVQEHVFTFRCSMKCVRVKPTKFAYANVWTRPYLVFIVYPDYTFHRDGPQRVGFASNTNACVDINVKTEYVYGLYQQGTSVEEIISENVGEF